MHHILAYNGTTGAAAADFDLTAAVDAEFSQRSGHYVFSERYRLLAAAILGATLTRGNIQASTWNAFGRMNIYPPNTALLPPSNAQYDVLMDIAPELPTNEEIAVKTSNTGAGEQNTAFLIIGPPDWNANLPRGQVMIEARCTIAATTVLATWSGLGNLVFEQGLKTGVYAVVGAQVVGANLQAFRFVFDRIKRGQTRKMRPGILATTTLGQVPAYFNEGGPRVWGEWGRFHTFMPPQIEFFATTSATTTYEVRLWCVYVGEDASLVDS
jgi:hypothetical protein